MVCPKCNASIDENLKFCPNCGASIENNNSNSVESEANVENTAFEVNNSEPVVNNAANVNSTPIQDKVNVWLVILSWFIPLAGLIIFFVKKKTSPKTAKASGICALISFLLNLIVVIASFSLVFGSVGLFNFTLNETSKVTDIIEEVEDIEDKSEEIFDTAEDIINNSKNESSDDTTTQDTTISDSTVTSTTVSSDWKLYQIGINGKVYALPEAYSVISAATGFSLKSDYLNLVVPKSHYALANLYKNDKLALYIELSNTSDAEAKYVDCKVTRVSQTKYQVSQGAEAIVFPGGLKVGDSVTETQLTTLFGQPSETKDNGSSKQYNYFSDSLWITTNNYKITVINGVIDEIQLDHRN